MSRVPKNYTRAEISRRYRERQRENRPFKKDPKSAKDRMRAYRQRKKALSNLSTSTENIQTPDMFFDILKKIGDGLQLEADELELIESRFFTKDKTNKLCPDGIRLFLADEKVNEYNLSVLNSAKNKVTSLANDIFVGCQNADQEADYRQKLHKMSMSDTGDLPHEIILVKNRSYMLTTDIDVADGLVKGQIGTLVHVECDAEGDVVRIWLEFQNAPKVGKKLRIKVRAYAHENKINQAAVSISKKTIIIYMADNKTISVERKHFPIISCCAATIHQTQGRIFYKIVYEYEKSHSQQLLYTALSRVTSIDGLYIVSPQDDLTFYHGQCASSSKVNLHAELIRFSLSQLQIVGQQVFDFISSKKRNSVFSLDCPNLQLYAPDLRKEIAENSMVLVLSEIWLKQGEKVDIPNFDCIATFNRDKERVGSVAIYRDTANRSITRTPHLAISLRQMNAVQASTCDIGDICAARCQLDNGELALIVAVYITLNNKLDDIIEFIHEVLLPYTPAGAALLKKDWGNLPMIMSGDFNVLFSKTDGRSLIDFLDRQFNLKINNKVNVPITKWDTTPNAVFSRNLDHIESETFVSYFNYHKPNVTMIETHNK